MLSMTEAIKNKKDYLEIKSALLNIVNQVREINAEKAEYLDRHFIFDDKEQTFLYDGVGSALEDVLNRSEILELSPYFPANG